MLLINQVNPKPNKPFPILVYWAFPLPVTSSLLHPLHTSTATWAERLAATVHQKPLQLSVLEMCCLFQGRGIPHVIRIAKNRKMKCRTI